MNVRNHPEGIVRRLARSVGRAMLPVSRLGLIRRINGTERLETQVWEYSHPEWPEASDGYSVLFVSDIHYGKLLSREQFDRMTGALATLESDCVLLGGDFGEDPEDSPKCICLLAPILRGRRVIAVPGNHDICDGIYRGALEAAVKGAGWEMPVNACVPLTGGAALAGLDDFREGAPDAEALKRQAQGSAFVVFLCHNPDALADIVPPFYQLALCGHTHGGQVTLFGQPIFSSSIYRGRYLTGWKRENGADILISNGIGTSLLPVRIGATPQMIKIIFRRGPAGHRLMESAISGYAGKNRKVGG
ncbi:MAG: metallophosphoesterase [Clostridia bacterium]|nr:metallophosphoesterase [Clostridia bacterium]